MNFEEMEAVVTAANGVNLKHNGLMESSLESLQDSWPEKKKPVEATSVSTGSDIEEENSVESPKRVSNKKRKRSKADEGSKAGKTKPSRKKRALKKEEGSGDEKKCEEKVKQRSYVNRKAITQKEEEEWEQELEVVSFIKATSRSKSRKLDCSDIRFLEDVTDAVSGSCSRSESDFSDSHLKNENFNDCRSMTRSLRVTFVLTLCENVLNFCLKIMSFFSSFPLNRLIWETLQFATNALKGKEDIFSFAPFVKRDCIVFHVLRNGLFITFFLLSSNKYRFHQCP